jgi:hypothetical protein
VNGLTISQRAAIAAELCGPRPPQPPDYTGPLVYLAGCEIDPDRHAQALEGIARLTERAA